MPNYRYYLLLIIFLGSSQFLRSQHIEIKTKNSTPYYLNEDIQFDIYLSNNTSDTLRFFDSRGPRWSSFEEQWEFGINNRYTNPPSHTTAAKRKYNDSAFISLEPNKTMLIRSKTFNFDIPGRYILTYTQTQGPKLVKKHNGDSTVSQSQIDKLSAFKVKKNLNFRVFTKYDTAVSELVNMSWEAWKEHRHVKLYSRKQHFTNIYDAHKNPQDVYSLDLYCNGMTEEDIIRLGRFKNLRALYLYNYQLNYFPRELAELELYQLTIVPKEDTVIAFDEGLSIKNSLRELKGTFNGGFPKEILEQEKLMILDMSDSPLETIPNLSSLQALEKLEANNTQLSTLEGIGLENLPKLIDLNFSGNRKIKDLSPLLACENLEFLVINRTAIPEVPDEIVKLKKLKKLSISSKITHVSDSIYHLEDMRYLSFGGNTKLEVLPSAILKMKKLHHLDISRTKIAELPEGIAELPLEKVIVTHSSCKATKDYKELKKRLESNFKD